MSSVLFFLYLVLLSVKKNHHDCFVTKYLIMFLSIQGLFFCRLNKLIFVFTNLCTSSSLTSGVYPMYGNVAYPGSVSVGNVVLKDTCSLSAYKYLPPPSCRLTAGRHDASGEKHVLLQWRSPEPAKVQHIVYTGSLCCRCSVTEGLCRHPSQQQQTELTGQLTSCFWSLGGCLTPR